MRLPSTIVNNQERVRSIDAARALGIDPESKNWGPRVAEQMRRLGYDGPRALSFGKLGTHRGYWRLAPVDPADFLRQYVNAQGPAGNLARVGLATPDLSEILAVAVASLVRAE